MAAPEVFVWGLYPKGYVVQGRSPGREFGDQVSQKLKQFADDIVYRF